MINIPKQNAIAISITIKVEFEKRHNLFFPKILYFHQFNKNQVPFSPQTFSF